MPLEYRMLLEEEIPKALFEIPEPPKALWIAGSLPPPESIFISFVGSRKHTPYGAEATRTLISGLSGYPIVIVSGLALGIDCIAHRAALESNLTTIAIPGSGLDPKVLYPRTHVGLAEEIVEYGGALISEFDPLFSATPWSFPQRNRIMAGLSRAVVVVEAEIPSGTLITSRLATEYNKEVMTIPGSIFSPQSAGPHMLLSLGATPIRSASDILNAVGIEPRQNKIGVNLDDLSPDEKIIYSLIDAPMERDDLFRKSKLPFHQFNAALSMLELRGAILETFGEIQRR
jgi:DNA processing protein